MLGHVVPNVPFQEYLLFLKKRITNLDKSLILTTDFGNFNITI